MQTHKLEEKLQNDSGASTLAHLLNLALSTTWDGFSIWRAIRDDQNVIVDFELIYSNDNSIDPERAAIAKLVHKPISEVIMNGDAERIRRVLSKALENYAPGAKVLEPRKVNGWLDKTENTVIPLTKNEVLITYRDISKENNFAVKNQWLYDHDPLTGLINQVLLDDMLNEALLQLQVNEEPFAFGIIDIDDFARINEHYGRDLGDLVLKRFAEIFQSQLDRRDRLVRLGEDDFGVILRDIRDLAEITAFSKRLMKSTNKTWRIQGNLVNLRFSAGFILINDHFASAREIYQLAELQMYKVKNQGKNGFISAIFHGLVNR